MSRRNLIAKICSSETQMRASGMWKKSASRVTLFRPVARWKLLFMGQYWFTEK